MRVSTAFTWAGASVSLSLPDARWVVRLSDLLGLVAAPSTDNTGDIRVHDATHLRSFATELDFPAQADLLVWLALTIVDVLAEKAASFLLHAASLRVDEGLVLLSGPPYSGKSTLALCALRRGMAVIGDDVVRLDLDTLLAEPVPRPLRERATSATAAMHDPLVAGTPLNGVIDGEWCRLHPRAGLPEATDTAMRPVTTIYFLRRHAGRSVRELATERFDATATFLAYARAWGPPRLSAMPRVASLLKSSAVCTLSIGDGEAERALDHIVQRQARGAA